MTDSRKRSNGAATFVLSWMLASKFSMSKQSAQETVLKPTQGAIVNKEKMTKKSTKIPMQQLRNFTFTRILPGNALVETNSRNFGSVASVWALTQRQLYLPRTIKVQFSTMGWLQNRVLPLKI